MSRRALRGLLPVLSLMLCLLLLGGAAVLWLNLADEEAFDSAEKTPAAPTAQQVQRGAYLARVGNCESCHTARGGAAYAGGRAIPTPFGVVYAGNLTPDVKTGLGSWNAGYFWRALHHGRSKDGRLLVPAFPYPQFTHVTREDSDLLFAYLRTLPAVEQAITSHALRWPYNTQAALALWRAVFFKPAQALSPTAATTPATVLQRGRYLVDGLGHCAACHSPRNTLGATRSGEDLAGGLIPAQRWYAPSLTSADEAGVADWPLADVVDLLQRGSSPRASVLGPMADVVYGSTQHLSDSDVAAVATYLKALPQHPVLKTSAETAPPEVQQRGAKIYEQHCAACHGDQGQGAVGAYPALAGNRAVLLASPVNLVQVVLHGGFAPATQGNPRPYGMPPFAHTLSEREVADVLTFLRQAWGHQAPAVSQLDVLQAR